MDRNKTGFVAVFLLFLIVADASDASLDWKLRKLAGETPKDNSIATPTQGSPVSGGSKLDPKGPKPIDANKTNEEKLKATQVSNNSSKVDPKGSNTTNLESPLPQDQTNNGKNPEVSKNVDSATPSGQNQTDIVKNEEKKKKKDYTSSSHLGIGESCKGLSNSCSIEKTLTACIESFESGSKVLVVIVQNEGDDILKVNLTVPTSVENQFKQLKIPAHQAKKVNISVSIGKSTRVILNAGKKECPLQVDPVVSKENFFLHLPYYDKLATPINGAYFLIVTVLFFGGTWACCTFRKRKRQGEIPYQELEMGLPESVSATNVETAEGWDQGWDDDWDEDKAVKSPGGHHVGNVSANGLTSRSSNRDGWENDWDD